MRTRVRNPIQIRMLTVACDIPFFVVGGALSGYYFTQVRLVIVGSRESRR